MPEMRRVKDRLITVVLGKLGPGRLGPGKLGPSPIWRQIGPRTFWGPICHFLANRAPADWAPWRQIGPRQIGPRQIGPLGGKLGPGNLVDGKSGPGKLGPGRLGPRNFVGGKSGPGKLGPGKSGPWIIWMRQIVFIQYKYIHIEESMSVGIGEYM